MTSPAHDRDATGGEKIRFQDRLLAETVRALEEDGASPRDDPAADAIARAGGGGLERRISIRAAALAERQKLEDAISSVRQGVGWIVLLLLILALIAGSGAARAAFGTSSNEAPVNIFWVLGSLLGLQVVLLLIWVLLMLLGPRRMNASPIGAAAFALGRRLVARMHPHAAVHAAAVQAVGAIYGGGSIGRWMLSAVSHATWTMFNVGCVLTLLLLLSWKHYTFYWETTILSADSYVRMTKTLSIVPAAIGFAVPDAEQIVASEAGADSLTLKGSQQQWSQFLIGSVVCYGLMPRFLLMLLCLVLTAVAARRFRLDLTAPGYLRLREKLRPSAESIGIIDRQEGEFTGPRVADQAPVRTPGEGPPVVLGLEIEPPASPWPPRLHSVRWVDLGFIDGRDDRRRVLEELRRLPESPRATVVVCGLTTTPDRGIADFVRRVQQASSGPMSLLLTGGEALRRRGDGQTVSQRVEDWRRLATELALPPERTIELDLDHLTESSARKLAALVAAGGSPEPRTRRLEEAFDGIEAAARSWGGAPNHDQAAELHRAIAELYRHESKAWWRSLKLPSALPRDASSLRDQMTQGAERFLAVLPDRLRRSPKWLAAGALSGAMGCVAASLLISPVAIASLPLWSGLGSAIAAALQPRGGAKNQAAGESGEDLTLASALRSAVLFAILLELQGRGEAAITEVLDRSIADEAFDEVTPATIDSELREVRHRFDLALSEAA